MENSARYILLLVGAFIIFGILWDGLRRKKRQEREAPIATINLKRVKAKLPTQSTSTIVLSEPEDGIVGEVRSSGFAQSNVEQAPIADTASVGEQAILQEELALAKPEQAVQEEVVVPPVRVVPLMQEGFVMLHVTSSYDEGFGGYPLLQTLLAAKLQFGAKKFFHRHENNDTKAKILFSVSSDQAPGTFNPTEMRNFQCQGLVLFMNAGQHQKPLKAFENMLETAEYLADSLDAQIFINQDQPCDDTHLAQLRGELSRLGT